MATKLNKNLTPQEKRLKRQQKRQDMLFDMAVQLDDTLRKPLRTKIEDV